MSPTALSPALTPGISGPADALRRLGASRDHDAWAWLCAELGPQLRRMTGRLSPDAATADDALQETLLTVRDHAGQFRPRQDPDQDARHWLLRVAANAALGLARRQRRARQHALRAAAAAAGEPTAGADPLEHHELAQQLRQALATLGERERTAIVLRVLEDLDYGEIAQALGCAEGTAKSLVSRGLQRLRTRLGRSDLSLLTLGLALPAPALPAALSSHTISLLHAPLQAASSCVPQGTAAVVTAKTAIATLLILAIATPLVVALRHPAAPSTAAAPAPLTATAAITTPPTVPPVPPAPAGTQDPLLEQTLTAAFSDTAVSDVVSYLQHVSKRRVILDPAVPADLTVTLHANQMSVANLLRWAFVRRHLRVHVGKDAVTISKPLDPNAAPDPDDLTLGPADVPLSAAPAPIQHQLAQQVHVDFQATALADVVQFMQSITNLSIIIDPDLDLKAGPASSTTVALDHTPISEVLTQASAQCGLVATWTDGAVLLSRPTASPALPRSAQ